MPSPVTQWVRPTSPTTWQIGSLVCEALTDPAPSDSIATWEESDLTYVLRAQRDNELVSSPETLPSDDPIGMVSAVWKIGQEAFCKAKLWSPGIEAESDVIAFVKDVAPQICVPEVIHSWIEEERSFLMIRRIKGSTLRDVWASLSPAQRDSTVTKVAKYCDILAQNTSPIMSSVTGGVLNESYLSEADAGLVGPLTREESVERFSIEGAPCPTPDSDFHLYHPNLGPGNIIMSEDGDIAGVIGWGDAGYYPRFWIATKPSVSPRLDLSPPVEGFADGDWRKRLRIELEKWGYPQCSGWYMQWSSVALKAKQVRLQEALRASIRSMPLNM